MPYYQGHNVSTVLYKLVQTCTTIEAISITICAPHIYMPIVNNNLYLLSAACVTQRFPEHNHKELIKNLNQKCRDSGKTDAQ